MEIKAITPINDEWTRVIDYAENCSWKAGVNLAKAMRKEQFTEWERAFVAIDDGEIAPLPRRTVFQTFLTLPTLALCLWERSSEVSG